MSNILTTQAPISRKLGSVLPAGALATTGIVAAQLGAAPAAQAAVCGSTSQSNGYAYANNPCGYAYAEVARKINGKTIAVGSRVYKKATSVSSTSGSRVHEITARW